MRFWHGIAGPRSVSALALVRGALQLEKFFDVQLGPYVRRFAFHALRSAPEQFLQTVSERRSDEALARVVAAPDRLESELGEHRYLVGERFTVADLTAAALFCPLVMPPEGPLQTDPPPAVANVRRSLQGRRGYRWVQEMFECASWFNHDRFHSVLGDIPPPNTNSTTSAGRPTRSAPGRRRQ